MELHSEPRSVSPPRWPLLINTTQLMTDDDAHRFIHSPTFASLPLLTALYDAYPRAILRTDILRYLLLYFYGGFYADIDTIPKRSVASCPALSLLFPAVAPLAATDPLFPREPPIANVSLVLGLEIDEPAAAPATKAYWAWSRTASFAQYTMYAPRRFSPLLRRVLARALAYSRYQNGVGGVQAAAGAVYTKLDVLEATGPGMLTDTVLDVLGETLSDRAMVVQASESAARVEAVGAQLAGTPVPQAERVTWAPFHGLKSPLAIDAMDLSGEAVAADNEHGGLLVLPINVWGNGQGHSGADLDWDGDESCVNHRFQGGWKHSFVDRLYGIWS